MEENEVREINRWMVLTAAVPVLAQLRSRGRSCKSRKKRGPCGGGRRSRQAGAAAPVCVGSVRGDAYILCE